MQRSVPAIGFTSLDHRQPGSIFARPTIVVPMVTISAIPFGNERVSSGLSMFFTPTVPMAYLLLWVSNNCRP